MHPINLCTLFGGAALAVLFGSGLRADPLKAGDPAPLVSGVTETGASLDFGTVYKQQTYTLVYFYPRAFTSGCTAQGCSLRDAYAALTDRGVAVIGVSTDPAEKQAKFKAAEKFPFTLIADPDQHVIDAFAVPTKGIPGFGTIAQRSAFLIRDGKIVWADYHASTKTQADDVLKVIAAQKS